MLRYIVKRIIILIPVVICITIILFLVAKMIPGDEVNAMLPPTLQQEDRDRAYAAMYTRLGLDKSLPEQYFRWMYNLIFEGDFGHSSWHNKPVAQVIGTPLKNTIIMNVFVNIIYLAIAIPVGIKMATKRGSLFDSGWQVFSLITYSVPSFFLALSLIFIFGVWMGILPMGGMPNTFIMNWFQSIVSWARYLVLPVATLVIISIAGALRYVRNAMIDALSQDYIRTARSKGLNEKVVIYSHALRNALIPISTIVVGALFALLGGATIVETVFQYNGIGRTLFMAVSMRDRMLIITMNLFFAMVSIISVLVADIIYGLVDPRIKLK